MEMNAGNIVGMYPAERRNMFASVLSAAILGMEVHPIHVEADVSDGLPSFTMVGLPFLPKESP